MASRNPKFSIPSSHAEALYGLSKACGLTPTRCLALLLDEAMPTAFLQITQQKAEGKAGTEWAEVKQDY